MSISFSVSLSPCLSLPLSPCPSLSLSPTHTYTQSLTQPEAFTHLFMHLSCTLVYLSASLFFIHTQNHANTHSHTQTLTVYCWKSARVVDPLVVEGIEVCWHVRDGGAVLILPMGLYKTLQTSPWLASVHPTAPWCELNHNYLKVPKVYVTIPRTLICM